MVESRVKESREQARYLARMLLIWNFRTSIQNNLTGEGPDFCALLKESFETSDTTCSIYTVFYE